jgi:hypothetical protein
MTGFARSHWFSEGDRSSDLDVEAVSEAAVDLRHKGGGGDDDDWALGCRRSGVEGTEREPRMKGYGRC